MPQPPRRSERVAYRAIEDEGILVPIRRSVDEPLQVHTLNPVAAFVWGLIDGQRSVGDLTSKVVSEFEIGEDVARADIESFLKQLEAAGLIKGGPG